MNGLDRTLSATSDGGSCLLRDAEQNARRPFSTLRNGSEASTFGRIPSNPGGFGIERFPPSNSHTTYNSPVTQQ